MNQWTDAARRMLEDCLNRNRTRFAAQGAEADEVAADLRRHLEFEADQERLKVVTVSDVQRLLARVDPHLMVPADPPPAADAPPPPRGDRPAADSPRARGGLLALWFFGVLLPLATLVLEYFSRMCADAFFDPLPTPLHVVLVGLVPMANAAVLLCLRRPHEMPPSWLWWLQAAGLGVSAAYAVAFLPLAPFAFMGIVLFGFGLLPLSPTLALIVGGVLNRRLNVRARESGGRAPSARWWGAAGAVALLLVPLIPTILTHGWLRDAADLTDPDKQVRAIRNLRRHGVEHQVLRAAYGQFSRGWMELGGSRPCSPADAQAIYFRMTGRPYNSAPPPTSRLRGQGRAMADEFEWDNHLGGESVAGRVTGLSLLSSRLDASASADDGWGYTEWTLEFRNDHPRRQREARALLQLPPGGVVSRVTLWVNGEEREAAFAGRSAARAAYREVAVEQRRDPILVTTAGPDRVLMQCFPIAPEGGVMKVRVGISAPLPALQPDSRAFLWPRMVERNFAIAETTRHHAWLELLSGTVAPVEGWMRTAGRESVVHAAVAERDAPLQLRSLILRPGADGTSRWARDDRAPSPFWVRQRLVESTVSAPARLALVIDGGRDGEQWFPEVERALRNAPGRGELALWVVHDGANPVQPGAAMAFQDAAEPLRAWKTPFTGGHDPGEALSAALSWAGTQPGGAVLWIHGPLPMTSKHEPALRQHFERNGSATTLFEISGAEGPNRLVEALDGIPGVQVLPRVGSLQGDLERFLNRWTGVVPDYRWTWETAATPPGDDTTGSRHLVRLWAAQDVERLRRARQPDQAARLAVRWQLVTPVSGAVVLETQEQFARHGLSPVDPLTTPMVVPEPTTWALLMTGAAALAWIGRKGRRRSPRTNA